MTKQKSDGLSSFCAEFAAEAIEAKTRDETARSYFYKDQYALYEQGSYQVIKLRTRAVASGTKATFAKHKQKYRCSICNEDVKDKDRHNQDKHAPEPYRIFYCPVKGCGHAITRDGEIGYDVHLAGHLDFRNHKGHGGQILDFSVNEATFNRIKRNALIYVAKHRQAQINKAVEVRQSLLEDLAAEGISYDQLEMLTLPDGLKTDAAAINRFKKPEAVEHVILARQTLVIWMELCDAAERKLPDRKKNQPARAVGVRVESGDWAL
ncbi:unnamed protein product [Discula destructiva]